MRFRKDASNRIRGNVLKALYNLGHRLIEDDLLAMLDDSDEFMKASALWVVSQVTITSPTLEDRAGKALISANEMVVRNARNALFAMGSPRARGYLRYLADVPEG